MGKSLFRGRSEVGIREIDVVDNLLLSERLLATARPFVLALTFLGDAEVMNDFGTSSDSSSVSLVASSQGAPCESYKGV